MVRQTVNVKREGNSSVDAAREQAKPLLRKDPSPAKFGNYAGRRDFPPGCGNRGSLYLGNKVEVSQNTFGGTKRSRAHEDDEDFDNRASLDLGSKVNVKRKGSSSVDPSGDKAKPLPRKCRPPSCAAKRDFPPGCGSQAKRSRADVDEEDHDKYVELRKSKLSGGDEKHLASRKKVEEVLKLFEIWWASLSRDMKAESEMEKRRMAPWTVYVETAVTLRRNNLWVNSEKRLGPVPGIEIGDKFRCRAMLAVVGLHHQFWCGIDYMTKGGKHLATSIVDSGRVYDNHRECPDVFIYSGHGGNPRVSKVKPRDQKPVRGNQALLNSLEAKAPVRVIRGSKCLSGKSSSSSGESGYVYVGLYFVERQWVERGCYGKLVFKFSLRRDPDQPRLYG